MLFNSFEFAIFFLLTFGLYWSLPHRAQNIMLLVASYVFYASWDWRFTSLILFCTIVSYLTAGEIFKTEDKARRKFWLIVSIIANLGVLIFFKYFNFFLDNIYALLHTLGLKTSHRALSIILPMGISFFTFQAMSYTIDIYRRGLKPMGTFFDFALFKAFFPLLMAGPIERATNLLPQILKARAWSPKMFEQGAYLILLGLFQKIFVADNLASLVNPVFANPSAFSGSQVLAAMYAFTLQIFCDFAGYSNMARGLGMTLGFNLVINFNLPFLATNVQDFWNRWHMSLSTWIRDYLYFPLMGGLRKINGNWRVYSALLISMTLMGLWHGASWNFVIFGAYYGLLLIAYIVIRTHFSRLILPKSTWGQILWFWSRVFIMFNLTALGMTLFRATSLSHAGSVLARLFDFQAAAGPLEFAWLKFLAFGLPVMLLQYGEFKAKDIFFVLKTPWQARIAVFAFMTYLMLGFGVMTAVEFIYFQF